MTLTAAYRISRRGIPDLTLFGVRLSTGTANAICQRASEALAGRYLHLQNAVLDQHSVPVDETGWRTNADGRAWWDRDPADAVFLQIAEHCNPVRLPQRPNHR